MQVAQIVVKVRTTKEDIFDYSIPPNLLAIVKIGILVEVNFHGRKVEGIIVSLKRSSKIEKLLPILSITDPNPVVDDIHIRLAFWMSDYYLAPMGKTLFENVVPVAKRSLKIEGEYSNLQSNYIRPKNPEKNSLAIADFKTRINFYLKMIEKTLAQNRSVIILVPDLSIIKYFTFSRLRGKKFSKSDISILHAGLTKTGRWTEWSKIRSGQTKIIIGSLSALFAPAKNLGLIIIDQEENETYKNDRQPRFSAVGVAQKLGDLSGASLILGSVSPRVETYWQANRERYKIFRKAALGKSTIVNMAFEKGIISHPLEQKITDTLKKNNKILLVLNRKGEGTKFSCPDCGWIAICEKCGLPLIPQKSENVCYHCERSFLKPLFCPKCKSPILKPAGLGTTRLKKILEKLYPKTKIIIIEKDSHQESQAWNIAIITSYALKLQFPKIGLVGIIDADQTLSLPDFSTTEELFETFYKFLRLGNEKVIQTHLIDHSVIKSLAALDYHQFLRSELSERKNGNFPPFRQLIRLEYQNPDLKIAAEECRQVFELINKLNDDSTTQISEPYQPFIQKKRHKFRYQIVIRTKNIFLKTTLGEKLKMFLKSLPRGWIIDVDPISLL
ncbi:MAG: primosomal protein N' [Patescibacteria group bacterium]|jgi:primosomal protein N' (replication factor Y)